MYKRALFWIGTGITLLNTEVVYSHDALVKTQKIASDAIRVYNDRLRVAAENSANAESADYAPKSIYIASKRDRKQDIDTVEVKEIKKNPNKMRKEYNPLHPGADAQGYVNLPDVSPLTEMVNLQQAKLDIERSMKVYEIATDLRYKMIGMMHGR
jgi:flagellar basal-body rod protein FlgC